MNVKRLAAWLLVLAALVAGWQLAERRGASDKAEGDRRTALLDLGGEPVVGLLVRNDGGTIEVRKGAGGWAVVSPISWEADSAKVEELLRELLEAKVERVVAEAGGTDPAQFGLASGASLIEVVAAGGRRAAVRVGSKEAVAGKSYLSRGSTGEVGLGPASLRRIGATSADELRDRTVLAFDAAERVGIEAAASPAKVTLLKEGGRWTVAGPVRDRADSSAVEALLGKLREPAIVSFIADGELDLRVYGLERPSLSIGLGAKGKPDAALHLGGSAPDGARYATRGDQRAVFTVSPDLASAAPADPSRWRDPSPMAFNADAVRGISVSWGNSSLALERSGDEWTLTGRPGYPVDRWEVQALLTALAGISAEATAAGRAPGGSAVLGEVVVRDGGKRVLDRLVVGPGRSVDRRTVAADSRPGLTFDLAAASADRIAAFATPFAVRKKEIYSLDPGAVEEVSVRAEGKDYRLERRGKRWRLVSPVRRDLDDAEANDLLWDLGAVRASGLVSEGPVDASAQGLESPVLKVDARLEGGSAVPTLTIGPARGDAHPALAGDPPAVYLVPAETVERIVKAFRTAGS